jgi:uncharacterized damage-inducible protein DinB
MTTADLLIVNFEEIRRRSIKVWAGIPPGFYQWQPDKDAMTLLQTVRHVLESEYWFHKIVESRKSVSITSPWENRPYTDVAAELAFAQPFRETFITAVKSFSPQDLTDIEIIRAEIGQRRKLGDYLLRIGYHESVHTGQLLAYLRTLQIERPKVWD